MRMEKLHYVQMTVSGAIGVVGGVIVKALGGWSQDLQMLIYCMAIDFLLGLLIAAIWKRSTKSINGALDSVSAWKGLCRKGASLLVVLVASQLDRTLGLDYIRTAAIIAFIANELISITENLGIMGVPLPPVITRAIDVLTAKSEGGVNDGNRD